MEIYISMSHPNLVKEIWWSAVFLCVHFVSCSGLGVAGLARSFVWMAFIPSLTGLACLAGLTLLIRMLRRAQKEDVDSDSDNQRVNRQAKLTKSTLVMLIETDALPYWILDVRHPNNIRRNPAPEILTKGPGSYMSVTVTSFVGCTSVEDISKVLHRRSSGDFSNRFPHLRFPDKDDVLVIVSDKIEQSKQGVKEVQAVGFARSLYLDDVVSSMAEPPKQRMDAPMLSKHAVAVLLKIFDDFSPVEATVIDLRRNDEHIAFGSIEGMKNIPGAELPRALTMEKTEFIEKYQFPKPSADDILVFSCRTNRRAKWAAFLCSEAGFKRVYVHSTGCFGWEFSSHVKKYESYEKGDPFPKPTKFKVDKPDRNAGLRELSDAGLTTSSRQDISSESTEARRGSTR